MSTSTAADALRGPSTIHGHIAARIDRLPLTAVQWRLAILVTVTWGFIIFDTDGIGARLYPFVWRPNNIITVDQYAVIQALQVGSVTEPNAATCCVQWLVCSRQPLSSSIWRPISGSLPASSCAAGSASRCGC